MDAVTYAVSKVKQSIPRQLLDEAFKPQRYDPIRSVRSYDNVLTQSIDDLIRTKVIDAMVAPDLENFAGTEDTIPLHLAERIPYDPWNVCFRFKERDLGGRTINKVHEVTYGSALGFGVGNFGEQHYGTTRNALAEVGRDVQRATIGTPSSGTAYVELIGPNTVLINDINVVTGFTYLRCTLSYDKYFNEIKPAYRFDFAKFVVLAAKAYIYNQLVFEVDEGVIRSGKVIETFKRTLDKFEDSLDMYHNELETTMHKIAIMNDTEQYRKVMKLALGSRPKL